MDTGWVQVFVLTLAECVAPAGKSVCQEQQVQYQFIEREECEAVLQQLVDYGAGSESVIVNEQRSSCLPTAVQQPVFASLDEANEELSGTEDWGTLDAARQQPRQDGSDAERSQTEAAHQQRLAALPECDDVARRPPCKVGLIIVEAEGGQDLEVWRRD